MVRVRVVAITNETDEIKTFRLEPCDGRALAPYEAGAHVDVTGPTGLIRQYSLCGSLEENGSYLIAVKREQRSRGGSVALHDDVAVGDELRVSMPRNRFRLVESVGEHALVAAGIGVTPLLAMAYQLHHERRPFRMHYFARSASSAAFVGLLENAEFADRVEFHFAVPLSEHESRLAELLSGVDATSHVYTCGPTEFMAQVTAVGMRSLPPEHIHVEHFRASELPAEARTGFEVELDTGEVFTVPADKSIAEVLEENGVLIDTSCREGICGTCTAVVRDGVPDHRDNCLTAKERAAGNRIALCVSRAASSRLVIEL